MTEGVYKNIPALAAYIERVGAEELNFRRFMVKEHKGGYYTERALIRINAEGEVTCSNQDYAPTAAEFEVIKVALRTEKFPKAILARDTGELKKLVGRGSALYEFVSRKPGENGIIMVQERATFADGRKAYLPWTFFSDGSWRRMEPDGALPFWKPEASSKKARIMVHEGAKAAAHVDALVNFVEVPAERHPWLDELSCYEHWGMIGGALAPHRADYEELRREKPVEVVYVCDNDKAGAAALQKVSKAYGLPLKGVMFDGRWPNAWDLGDEMPRHPQLFSSGCRWIGPTLKELKVAATRATERAPNPEGGKGHITIMRDGFKEEWLHAVTPEAFVHRDWPNRILSAAEFNSAVAPFSDVDDTARIMKKDAASKSAMLKYSPASVAGIYGSGNGGRYINTHVPGGVVAEKGDASQFIDFIEHLVPGENDRLELLRWCATLVCRPDIKMLYGVLLISENQGIGKGTLGEKILAPLVGEANVSYPSEQEIVESSFNYWSAHKRLAVVHEIYAGHSSKAYQRLQSIITDKYLTVSKKFMANYEIENWVHIFACSNSKRAIQLPGDDRRWFVPKITEVERAASAWVDLNRWLTEENGLGIIRWWLGEFLAKIEPVSRGARAPWSTLKREVVEEGYSPGMVIVAQFLDRVTEEMKNEEWLTRWTKPTKANGTWKPSGVVILDSALVKLIRDTQYEGRPNDRVEKPLTLRKVAKFKGWKIHDDQARLNEWGTRGVRCQLLCSSAEFLGSSVEQIAERVRPLDVDALAANFKVL